MATLNDFPKIAKSLKTSSKNQIQLLHRLIFGDEGDWQNRSRLRKFSGFPSDFQFEETKQKVVAEFSLKDLIAICNLLHLQFYTDLDKCCDTILTHLSDLSLLTTEASDFSETDDLEESEPKLTDSQQSVSNKLIFESQKEHRKSQIVSDESAQNSLPSFDLQHTLSNSFQAFSLKDIVDLVKPFSSRDNYSIQIFISDVEDIFNFQEIKNPIHQVIFVEKSLTGPALTLMRSIRGITNWEQMKQHSLDEFSDKINILQLHKLMESQRMKPFETLQEYFLAMRDLAHKCSLDDSSLNETFRPNNDKKFDDSTHAAKFERKRTPNPQPVCYSCGLIGHKSTQCTNKPHGKQCYGCKNFGHIHANCPQNSRNSASKSDSKLATPARNVNQISAQNIPQNHVDITLSGIQLTALCDTDSQATIINEITYLQIGSPPLYPSQITFSVIGRNTVRSIGFFQDSITVQNLTLPAKIHVLSDDTLPLDALIGIDFLQQTQFTFDKDGIRSCSNNDEYFCFMLQMLLMIVLLIYRM
ncbi:hypothetical protein AVEN_130723-1 [Araneus ventricosus]|uniref:CCHC-type domain-containing protein n=1 Tax=Araneus ventricosus TaxID=182803 RepID=A0A4Y2W3E0_ARAVE|nr:hypothetical protein AVEN_130723-1 [Araneus ventricosus]